MNGDLGLAWWLMTVPARFVYGVAVGIGRLVFGDDGPASPPQSVQDATEAHPDSPGHPQPVSGARSGAHNPTHKETP